MTEKKVNMSISIPEDLKARIKKDAKEKQWSMAVYIVNALKDFYKDKDYTNNGSISRTKKK